MNTQNLQQAARCLGLELLVSPISALLLTVLQGPRVLASDVSPAEAEGLLDSFGEMLAGREELA